ncbi:MAG: hypothetical protein V8R81_03010 [Clostridia bacterium]
MQEMIKNNNENKEKNIEKKQTGITLIVLVITIIILLILAGVSIAMLTGNNGILTQAKNAKEATEKAAEKENNDLLEIEMRANNSIANIPNLKEGMIPVKWDASNKTWEVADKNNTGNDWYDYSISSKKWANVVTVKENCSNGKTRADYLSAGVGTAIPEEDITTMFVWIPRYSYYVKSGYHENANGTGEFSIKFLIGTSDKIIDAPENQDTAIRSSETNKEKYVVHPAFTADIDLGGTGSELSGIWVGKFESSNYTSEYNNKSISTSTTNEDILYGRGDNKNVTIKPNVTSWRSINANDIFTVSQNMSKDEDKIYGFNSPELTTTMMQNSQWGAVAYLTQSEYGNMQKSTDGESGIWNNSYNEGITYPTSDNGYKMYNRSVTLTGISGSSRDNSTNYFSKVVEESKKDNGDSIEITYTTINDNATTGGNYTNTYYRYYTENGQKASTTRNIYGIYDMSGGALEYMANYLESATSNSYVTSFLNKDKKYQTQYAGTGATSSTADRTINYEANKGKYGDAIWETSNGCNGQLGWNQADSYFPYAGSPFFLRGGNYNSSTTADLFYINNNGAWEDNSYSFRVVLF